MLLRDAVIQNDGVVYLVQDFLQQKNRHKAFALRMLIAESPRAVVTNDYLKAIASEMERFQTVSRAKYLHRFVEPTIGRVAVATAAVNHLVCHIRFVLSDSKREDERK